MLTVPVPKSFVFVAALQTAQQRRLIKCAYAPVTSRSPRKPGSRLLCSYTFHLRQEPLLLSLRHFRMPRSKPGRSTSMAYSLAAVCEPCLRLIKCQREQQSVGEQSTGACIGTQFRGCLVIRGYASAAGLTLIRQSFRLCAALFRGGSISRLPPPTEKLLGVHKQLRR
jgi:hypothetical protein